MKAVNARWRLRDSRCGAVLVWAAGLLVLVMAMTAFAVDIGYMSLVATQLQNAADGAALSGVVELQNGPAAVLAEVQDLASKNRAAGNSVSISAEDVELGWYDSSNHTFTTPAENLNAIRVTARTTNKALFFAPMLGQNSFSMSRSATAILNPRDIAFVVDLSGSMNDDTEPCWATDEIAAKFTPLGYPTVSAGLMQEVYSDFGFGAFPGDSEYIFQPLGMTVDSRYAYAEATRDDGPLTLPTVDPLYRILNTDDEQTREHKAYAWLMDVQIPALMPGVKPIPDSTNSVSYAYWEKYIDYIIDGDDVGVEPPPPPDDGSGSGSGSGTGTGSGTGSGTGTGSGGGGGGGEPPPPPPPSGFLIPQKSPRTIEFARCRRQQSRPTTLGHRSLPFGSEGIHPPQISQKLDLRSYEPSSIASWSGHSKRPPVAALQSLDLAFEFTVGHRPRDLGVVAGLGLLPNLNMSLIPTVWGGAPPGVGVPRNGSYDKTDPPFNQDDDRIDDFNNPNRALFPNANDDDVQYWRNTIGHLTYVQFMMDWGRDRTPVEDNHGNAVPGAGTMTPLSLASPDCPLHSESTAGGSFDFPPREQPMHAVRRALIAVANEIKTKNAGLTAGTGDRVCLVTYDGVDANHQPTIVVPLTDNFDAVMTASSRLQAVSDIGNTTATENGIVTARQHIASPNDGGLGRSHTTKVVVLCTDGVPNVWQSSSSDINAAITAYPSGDYYASGYLWYNSVLRQAADMQRKKEKLYPVGMGLGADLGFLDRVARLAQTDEGGLSPRGTGNPADYEQQLINIFQKIINTRSGKLVK